MGTLWGHSLAVGWLRLFRRLRFLRLLGLDQLRLSDSDKLEGKRQIGSDCWTRGTQTTSLPLDHCRRRSLEVSHSPSICVQSVSNPMDNPQESSKRLNSNNIISSSWRRSPSRHKTKKKKTHKKKSHQKPTTQGTYSSVRCPDSTAYLPSQPCTPTGLGLPHLLQGFQHRLAVHLQDMELGLIFHPPIRNHCHQVETDVVVRFPAGHYSRCQTH